MLSAVLLVAMLLVAGPSQESAHLKIATSVTPETAKPGAKVALAIDVTPKPGIHVYAPGQDGYIAITVKIDPQPAFSTAGKAKYPEPEKFVMPALNETQLVYNKPFRITQDVTIGPKLGSGPLTIKGSIRYQACSDKICFLPATIPVTWTINPAARQQSQSSLTPWLLMKKYVDTHRISTPFTPSTAGADVRLAT